MSAFCRRLSRRSPKARAARRGFTLLEVLVVLALVGMLTALSLPQFSVVRDRLEFTLNRDSFERELGGLSYAAFKEGHPIILAGKYPRAPGDTHSVVDDFEEAVNAPLFLERGQMRARRPVMAADATFNLPATWSVNVETPIVYQTSGFCSGGSVTLSIGRLSYIYDLKSPTCQAELAK